MLDHEGPLGGHHVVSMLDYKGPPSGHQVVFFSFAWKPPNSFNLKLRVTTWWPLSGFFFLLKDHLVLLTLSYEGPLGGCHVVYIIIIIIWPKDHMWPIGGFDLRLRRTTWLPPSGFDLEPKGTTLWPSGSLFPHGNHLVAIRWFQP